MLFPVLQQLQQMAMKNMEAVPARRREADRADAALDPAWKELTAATKAKIETARGMISERFARLPPAAGGSKF